MSKKAMAEKAQIENVNVKNEFENAKIEAQRLAEEAKKAAAAAKEAMKAAKAAAEKARVMTSRPVRLAKFQAEIGSEIISKSDVHYCAEKAAIDYVTDLRNTGSYENQIIEIWKRYKDENQGIDVMLSRVYIDASTSQIVID